MMRKTTVEVTVTVEVTIDSSKFTDEFMGEFRKSFFPFDTLDEHIEHLAQLRARGVYCYSDSFIEGYGVALEMGIQSDEIAVSTEIVTRGEAS